MPKQRVLQAVFISIVSVIGLTVLYMILKRPEPSSPPLVITLEPRPTEEPATPTPATINVYVTGAVHNPDVYTLPLNSIVKDAVTAAGGPTAEADLDRINLALHLADQMQVYVPRKGEAAPPPNGDSAPAAPAGKINLNTASAEELDKLPGIGPTTAQLIIDYRTKNGAFKTIEEIKEVPRIGDSLFQKIKDSITVEP